MKSFLIATVTLTGLLSLTAARADAQAGNGESFAPAPSAKLANSDVTDMVKAGLPEDVIIAKIQTTACNFDTSPAALATLKSLQVPNAVILAVVKKSNQTNGGEERENLSASTRTPAPVPTPEQARASGPQSSKGCMAIRPIGSHAFRNVLLFGAAGALISHMQYQVVDAVDYPAKVGQKYHGNDLQTIQGSGTKVILLAKHYTAEDLHVACHQ